jgi:nucleoside-diphosphate-sugar epimerase
MELGGRLTGRPPALGRDAVAYVSRRAVFPNTRAREELGWEPRVDLAEGMRRTEAWLRAQGLLNP